MWVPLGLDLRPPYVRVARIRPLWRIIRHVNSLFGASIRRLVLVFTKEKYPKKKLTIDMCEQIFVSSLSFCLTENSQILLKRHYENELSLPCSNHLIFHLRCMKINIYLKIRSKKLHFSYKTGKCVNNEFGPHCYCM